MQSPGSRADDALRKINAITLTATKRSKQHRLYAASRGSRLVSLLMM